MDSAIAEAIRQGGIVDITTIGRRSGKPRRIEIHFHNFGGELYITGRPGFSRDWLANLSSNPRFVLHLKRGVQADLEATAEIITDPDRRRPILYRARTESWGVDPAKAEADQERWVASAPLIRFELDGA